MGVDMRKSKRFAYVMPVTGAISLDKRQFDCELQNFSSDGLCITTPARVPLGEAVTVSFNDIEIEVKRVWMRPESLSPLAYKFGLEKGDKTQDLSGLFGQIEETHQIETVEV